MLPSQKSTPRALCPQLLLLIGASLATPALADVIYQQDFENFTNAEGLWSSNNQSALGGTYTTVLGNFGAQTVNLNILANESNSTGSSVGGNPGSNPFNITVTQLDAQRHRQPYPESGSTGGGPGGNTNSTAPDVPSLNLGEAISGSNGGGDQPPIFAAGTYRLHFDLMLFDSWDGAFPTYGPDTFGVAMNGQTLFDEILWVHAPDRNFRLPDESPEQNVFNQNWADIIYRDIALDLDLNEATDRLLIDFIGGTTQSLDDESWGIDNILVEYIPSLQASTPDVPAPGSLVLLGAGSGLFLRRRRSNTDK